MKNLTFMLFILLFACSVESQKDSLTAEDISASNKQEVEKALMSVIDFINNEDLSDSLTYNRYKALYHDDFVLLPSNGEPISDKETILEGFRGFLKNNKGSFDITIDRLDVSGNLAYVLSHYHEVFTNIESGENVVDIMHSAIFVLKKDANNDWKIVVWRWT